MYRVVGLLGAAVSVNRTDTDGLVVPACLVARCRCACRPRLAQRTWLYLRVAVACVLAWRSATADGDFFPHPPTTLVGSSCALSPWGVHRELVSLGHKAQMPPGSGRAWLTIPKACHDSVGVMGVWWIVSLTRVVVTFVPYE